MTVGPHELNKIRTEFDKVLDVIDGELLKLSPICRYATYSEGTSLYWVAITLFTEFSTAEKQYITDAYTMMGWDSVMFDSSLPEEETIWFGAAVL